MNTEQIELMATFRDETKAERVKAEKKAKKLGEEIDALRKREKRLHEALRDVQPELAPA